MWNIYGVASHFYNYNSSVSVPDKYWLRLLNAKPSESNLRVQITTLKDIVESKKFRTDVLRHVEKSYTYYKHSKNKIITIIKDYVYKEQQIFNMNVILKLYLYVCLTSNQDNVRLNTKENRLLFLQT